MVIELSDLNSFDVPSEIIEFMNTWDVICKSPYSDSFYSSTDIDWGHKPDKSYRVSDHWNFKSKGRIGNHCETIDNVMNDRYISIGQFDKKLNKYKIILSITSEKYNNELIKKENYMLSQQDINLIEKKRLFKQRILNGEITSKFEYLGDTYFGIVEKYTGCEIRLLNNKFSGSNKNGRFRKIKNLELFDETGIIEDILKR